MNNSSSADDYTQILGQEQQAKRMQWQTWLHRVDELSQAILRERNGEPLDVATIVDAAKAERDERT